MRRDTHFGSGAFHDDEAKSGKLLQHAIAEPQHRESIETQASFARRTWPGCKARIYTRTVRADGVSFELLVLIVRAKPEAPVESPVASADAVDRDHGR